MWWQRQRSQIPHAVTASPPNTNNKTLDSSARAQEAWLRVTTITSSGCVHNVRRDHRMLTTPYRERHRRRRSLLRVWEQKHENRLVGLRKLVGIILFGRFLRTMLQHCGNPKLAEMYERTPFVVRRTIPFKSRPVHEYLGNLPKISNEIRRCCRNVFKIAVCSTDVSHSRRNTGNKMRFTVF